jgi:hypothetical protein
MSSLIKFFYARPQDVGMVILASEDIVRLMHRPQDGEEVMPAPDSPYAQTFTEFASTKDGANKKKGAKRKRYVAA